MRIIIEENESAFRILINEPRPIVNFEYKAERIINEYEGLSHEIRLLDHLIRIREEGGRLIVSKDLDLREHVLGLGEKAFELDRRRIRVRMWNLDASAPAPYNWYSDPLYASIPFLISVRNGEAVGLFVNSPAELIIDTGLTKYDEVTVLIPHNDVELYLIKGPSIERVIENYTSITGKPLDPPDWALDYQISRCCGYEPQDMVIRIIDEYDKFSAKPAAVYLDLQYMDSSKTFTWDRVKFPNPRQLTENLHDRGVRLVTIIDHWVKLDQNYEVFISGLGKYCETPNGELYTGRGWPGTVVFPDFFNKEAREWWASLIERWVREYGVDGIWLDMNEPTDYVKEREWSIDRGTLHRLDDGRRIRHELARNAYPYFQAMATYEGLKRAGHDKPFILSRAGYAGIQKYAFLWSADNTPSQDDVLLQLQLMESMSLSGVPFFGCDIGGFIGRGDSRRYRPYSDQGELLVKYYRAALFFPLFRVHTSSNPDREPYMLRSDYANAVKRVIELRRSLMPYLLALASEAHETGHPLIRPLVYHFQDDEDAYHIIDEYMVGSSLLYAPQIYGESRRVYLPKGNWTDWWSCEEYKGPVWIESSREFPLFIRENSIIPATHDLRIYGNGSIRLRDGRVIERNESVLRAPGYSKAIVYGNGKCSEIKLT
ncbi:alpha-glucosidase MalA [Caldivirga maquilingensis]|uniref:Alpha-glucosidase n=1 Tax=Caldivirga maquilingensis (strain ATCC 700844 / DSM 13496 / JCM 10307 / IC-167) TaxID=397948 RepID=A8M9Y0_CALMQ|nr:alpha-glucosidase MalA [Caldivirga maquilingensis]ABW02451.1 Alpha-glucosidase [Caldivirga maquilingensis IC-167]